MVNAMSVYKYLNLLTSPQDILIKKKILHYIIIL